MCAHSIVMAIVIRYVFPEGWCRCLCAVYRLWCFNRLWGSNHIRWRYTLAIDHRCRPYLCGAEHFYLIIMHMGSKALTITKLVYLHRLVCNTFYILAVRA